MSDPTPADVIDEGTIPTGDAGKSPDGGNRAGEEEPRGRQYSEAYVKQLRTEAGMSRSRIAELEERLEEHESAGKTELERATTRAETAEKRANELETFRLRVEVATDQGLGLDAVRFLTGSTREEIEVNAQELGKMLSEKAKPTTAGFDGGARKTAQDKKAPEVEHNDFLLQAMGRQRAR
jgi:hypothetical protein